MISKTFHDLKGLLELLIETMKLIAKHLTRITTNQWLNFLIENRTSIRQLLKIN